MAKREKPIKINKAIARAPRKSSAEKTRAAMAAVTATLGPAEEDAVRASFLQLYGGTWKALQNKLAEVRELKREVHATIKAAGHEVQEFKFASEFNGNEKEHANAVGSVEMRLRVMKYLGDPRGAQLDIFAQPDRTPATVRAYDQGKVACMEGKPCSPPYDASVPQYAEWINGYHDETARRVKAGIRPLAGDGRLDEASDDDKEWDKAAPLPSSLRQFADPARPL